MKKILLTFGTRPEAIKMAPVVHAIKLRTDIMPIVCVTGQHRKMLDQVLDAFEIKPDYDLNIMKPGQDLYDITAATLVGMRDILIAAKPDMVLVHGDTTTSTAAALAAFYSQIAVGHVEAGLRTNNIYSPWPEEMNRQLTGRIARWHFAPTKNASINLLAEGVNAEQIYITGNTVIDALGIALNKLKQESTLQDSVRDKLITAGLTINTLSLIESGQRMVLITGHRRENFGSGFENICTALADLANRFPDTQFVYPVHLNPNVLEPVHRILGKATNNDAGIENIHLIEPLDYLPFVYLMNMSFFVLTDSGGVQEEAPGLGKPVLVMRDTTERPEAVDAGTVKLVGANSRTIIEAAEILLTNNEAYNAMSQANNPYGDGLAGARIAEIVSSLTI